MVKRELKVENASGFHVRASTLVCKEAMKYSSEINLNKGGYKVDCKSALDLLTVMAPRGMVLSLTVEGEDEQKAADAITSLFEHKFYEDEFA